MCTDHQQGSPQSTQSTALTSAGLVDAGFWRRLLAAQIDFFGCCLVFGVALGFVKGLFSLSELPDFLRTPVLLPIILFLYAVLAESSRDGATLGKRLLHLKVQGCDGARLSFARSAARQLLRLATFFVLPFALLWISLSSTKQGLHDLIVRTRVVRFDAGPCSRIQPLSLQAGEWKTGSITVLIALLSTLILAWALYGAAIMLLKGLAMQGVPA